MCKPAFKELAEDLAMELMQEAKEKGFDYEDLADYIGGTKLTMKAYHYGDSTPSLAVFIGLWKKVKPEKVLKRFANWSGYAVFKLPNIDTTAHPVILTKKTAQSLKEFSEFLDEVGNSLADNKITKTEAQKIEKEGLEAIEKILEIIHIAKELSR